MYIVQESHLGAEEGCVAQNLGYIADRNGVLGEWTPVELNCRVKNRRERFDRGKRNLSRHVEAIMEKVESPLPHKEH